MKKILSLLFVLSLVINIGAQTKYVKKPAAKRVAKKTAVPKANPDLTKVNDSIPALIPQKKNGKFGFINQKGKVVIPHQYSNVGFYGEDCNLLNSKNEKAKKYGTDKYASVRLNGVDYRIDYTGKRVYKYQDSDLAKCPFEYKKQLFHAYNRQGYYGVIEDSRFENAEDYRHYQIYPQYELSLIHI